MADKDGQGLVTLVKIGVKPRRVKQKGKKEGR